MKKSTKYLLIIFASVCIYLVVSNWSKYQDGNSSIKNTAPIEYMTAEKTEHSGGRGNYYTMKIIFNQKEYSVAITKKNYGSEQKIDMYYSKFTDSIYSSWEVKKTYRLIVMSVIGLLIIISVFLFSIYKK